MAIGERIRFFRNRIGITQKQLGERLGFLGKTSDVRIAQYESETRVPKDGLIKEMADIFDVSSSALTVPDIDNYIGLMHTLFALEDMYGFKITKSNGELYLDLNKETALNTSILDMLNAWQEQSKKLETGQISKDDYDTWRYKYPELDISHHWAKLPSEELDKLLLDEVHKIN